MPDFNFKHQFNHQDVDIISTQNIYQGFTSVDKVSLRHKRFQQQQFGQIIQREVVHRRQAAGVFVHDPILRKFLLIEQFRIGAMNAPTTPWQLEIIAGLIDHGETAAQCLQREALEEAHCTLDNIQFIQTYHTSTGASDEIFHFYVATADLHQAGGVFGEPTEGEDIQVHVFDYQDVDALFSHQLVCNAPLLIALQWFKLFLSQHQ